MRHALVRALVQHYAQRAGYTAPVRVLTRVESFDRIARRYRQPLTQDERSGFAVVLYGPDSAVVWVNPKKHETIAELLDTAAHEAVHLAGWRGRHGREFYRRVKHLLRGGSL